MLCAQPVTTAALHAITVAGARHEPLLALMFQDLLVCAASDVPSLAVASCSASRQPYCSRPLFVHANRHDQWQVIPCTT